MSETGPDFPQMQTSSLGLANTNSQFYMWEGPANPVERADFEEDLIASTNENLYQKPLEFSKPHKAFQANHENFFSSPLFDQELERSH